jgi:hypothetical protein
MLVISSKHKSLIQLALSLFTAIVCFLYFNRVPSSFENLAMGTQTSIYQAKNDKGELIHFLHLDTIEIHQLESLINENNDSVILFLGNSQSHSINQMKKNDCNYIELVSKKIPDPCLAFTIPNGNLQEYLLTLDYLLRKVKIKKLFLPVFMDDLREDGIRDVFFSELIHKKYQIHDNSLIAKQINLNLKASDGSEKNQVEHKSTPQDKSEDFLNNYLNQRTSFWSMRETMRGNLFNWLYILRNTIFGIRPGTVRPLIPERYIKNISSLKAILDISKTINIEVYLYIPPIRSDVSLPYDIYEYEKFKLALARLVFNYSNAKLKDYSTIVPSKFWGYKDPTNFIDKREVDFMHFQYGGHQILADSIINFIK